jgi:hypothetical protein
MGFPVMDLSQQLLTLVEASILAFRANKRVTMFAFPHLEATCSGVI